MNPTNPSNSINPMTSPYPLCQINAYAELVSKKMSYGQSKFNADCVEFWVLSFE